MLTLKKQLLIGLAAAGIGLTALTSFAQMPPPGPGMGAPGKPGQHAPSPEQIAKMEARHARHLAELHEKLRITAAQEAVWKSFADKMTPHHWAPPAARLGKEEISKLTTPERMERRLEMMKKHQERMTEHLAATKELYAALTPEQQKLFDQETRKMESRRFGPRPPKGKEDGKDNSKSDPKH